VTEASNRIVQKLWSYCNVLRDDGLSYQDYLEQLTYLLFDESLEDSANLPDPNVLAQEIADDLRSALGQIEDIVGDLERRAQR
jgi:hypothetical protein